MTTPPAPGAPSTPPADGTTRAGDDPTENTHSPEPGRYDGARTVIAATIGVLFLIGALGLLGHSLLFPREPKTIPPTSAIPNGPWRGTITWDNNSSTAVWFTAKNGRVRQLTIYQPPPSCTRQQPFLLLMHATENRLNTRSTSTGPWTIKAFLESPILVTGSVTPRGECTVSGRITAWPRNS